jgi:multiple sugar transport system permease protein
MTAQARKRQEQSFAYGLILPSAVLVTLLNFIPLIEGVIVSFQRQQLMQSDTTGWVGLSNYSQALFDEAVFWPSLGRTIFWMVGAVGGAYVIGMFLSLLLNREDLKARALLRALFLVPWVVPDVVTSLIWKWMYNDQFGLINYALKSMGLIKQPILFLADPHIAMLSLIVVQVWKLYPLMTVMLLAALQNIPKELYEAAMIDGSSTLQRAWHITLPLIRQTSIIITLLMAIWTFNHFDVVYLLTGGGPANATSVLSILVYNKAFFALNLGYAASIGVLMLLTLSVFGILYLRMYRTREE